MRSLLGLDIGGTNVKAVLLGGDGEPYARGRWRSAPLGDDPASVIAGLGDRIEDYLRQHDARPGYRHDA